MNQPQQRPRQSYGCLQVTLLLGGLLFAAVLFEGAPRQAGDPATGVAEPLLSAQQRADCAQLLIESAAAGVIKARPSPSRIEVEDQLWAQLPADLKRKMLAAVSCEVRGEWVPSTIAGPTIVAYGYRSGKRVALLTSVGVSFE